MDSAGVASTVSVDVAWAGGGFWASVGNGANFLTNTPDNALQNGYLDNANGGTSTVTITNLTSDFTANGYDLYIYCLGDTGNRGGAYRVVDLSGNPLTDWFPYKEDTTPTNYVRILNPPGGTNAIGNYIVIPGLTNRDFTLQASTTQFPQSGTPRAIICGLQLVQTPNTGDPGPATALTVVTNGTTGQLLISWTPGAGSSGSLVVMRQGTPETALPVDGTTYAANSDITLAPNLGDDETGQGNFAVYNGSGSSVTVSNLTPFANYYVAVYPFNATGVSPNYTLQAPPRTNAVAVGNIIALDIHAPSAPLIANSARKFKVEAVFENFTSNDFTATANIVVSNATVAKLQATGRLALLTNGVASVQADFAGVTNSIPLTVVSMFMTHRYSFNDPGFNSTSNMVDSVGGADGTLITDGTSAISGAGTVILSGNASNYIVLPPDLLTNYGAVTIEAWNTVNTQNTWQRLMDFGSGTVVYFFLSPAAGNVTTVRGTMTVASNGANEQDTADGVFPSAGVEHVYTYTVAGGTRTSAMYIDGVRASINTNATLIPEDLGPTPNDYLGRSQWADPYFTGTIDEFRIYNGALSPTQIAFDAATGPDSIVTDPGAITGITLTLNDNITTLKVGQKEQVTVMGTFVNIPNPVNLTGLASYSVVPTNIVAFNTSGQMTGRKVGTTTITASYGGMTTAGQTINVIALPATLDHRYSFTSDVTDSIGGANGVAFGTVVFTNGMAVLDGVNAETPYMQLPADLFTGYAGITIEAWVIENNSGTWARIWDFGNSTSDYMNISIGNGGRNRWRVETQTGTGTHDTEIERPSMNVEHQIVWMVDPVSQIETIFLDGVGVVTNAQAFVPSDMNSTANLYFGKSQFNDPYFSGALDDVRIWSGPLSAQYIAVSYGLGPNVLTTVTNPGAASSLSVTVPSVAAGASTLAKAIVNFASVSGANMAKFSSNWVSSDTTIAKVDQTGLVTGVGAGSATITATFAGVTGSGSVTVTAATPPVLAHRYSFTSDASDSVGGANGTNNGNATILNGEVVLDGTAGTYVSLPGGLITGMSNLTIETWSTFTNATPNNSFLWCFGWDGKTNWVGLEPKDGNGNTLVNYAPTYTNSNARAFVGGTVTYTFRGNAFGTGTGTNLAYHAVVISDSRGIIEVYENGFLVHSEPWAGTFDGINLPLDLSMITNVQTYIGHSVQTNGTPAGNYVGAVSEFRIWNGDLTKAQVAASYAAGPDTVGANLGAASGIVLTLNDPVAIQGTTQKPRVNGVFAGGNVNLTDNPGVGLTSSAPGVAQIDGNRVKAVSPGTATITATYGGQTASATLTVSAKQFTIEHRYSFLADASDSVGHADGALRGHAAITNHAVRFDGTIQPLTYVELPSDLISGYDSLTMEAFLNLNNPAANNRIWEFGETFAGNGRSYLSATTGNGAGAARAFVRGFQTPFYENPLVSSDTMNNEGSITIATNLNQRPMHFVAVYDQPSQTITAYTNGAFAGVITNREVILNNVNDVRSYLGRSVWQGDPTQNGAIDEVRIYYGMISSNEVALSYASGPDPEKLTVAKSGANVNVSWPALTVLNGYTLQTSPSITAPVWSAAGASSLINNSNVVTVPISGSPQYFRLIKTF